MNKSWEILCRLFSNEFFGECYFISSGKTLREAQLVTEEKEDTGLEHTPRYFSVVRKKRQCLADVHCICWGSMTLFKSLATENLEAIFPWHHLSWKGTNH